jgi:2-aminoadipate transaminase
VITLCTFSKIFAPGFRVGWVIGQPLILDKIVLAKQTADLCTSAFLQRILARYIEKGLLEINLPKTILLYRERRDFMLHCLTRYMPDEVIWTKPEGGLFLFVTMPARLNAASVLKKAIDHNVAFVDGSTFFCNDQGHNTMRINFSYSDRAEIEAGVERLSKVIKAELEAN